MADQLLYDLSVQDDSTSEVFLKKEYVYVPDENQGSYTSQVSFTTAAITNSGRWASWKEAYVLVPFKIAAQCDADITAFANQYTAGLKAGYFHITDSMSVTWNNTTVVQNQSYLSHYVTYKMLTTMSHGDVEKIGSSIGFFPDTFTSHTFDSTPLGSRDGHGLANNRSFGTETPLEPQAYGTVTPYNRGLFRRQQNVVNHSTTGVAAANNYGGLISTAANKLHAHDLTTLRNSGASVFYDDAGAGAARVYQWDILAKIRLCDVCDLFDKLPLTRGGLLKIVLNINTSTQVVARANQPLVTLAVTSLTMTAGNTNPLVIASANGASQTGVIANGTNTAVLGNGAYQVAFDPNAGQGANLAADNACAGTLTFTGNQAARTLTTPAALNITGISAAPTDIAQPNLGAANGNLTVACGIGKATIAGTDYAHNVKNCRLYVPLVTTLPQIESRYTSLNKTKSVTYEDVYQYLIANQTEGTILNNILTTGIVNAKRVLIIPYYNKSVQPAPLSSYPVYQSPFTSEPGTSSPFAYISDFNVDVSGIQIYPQNLQYDWEVFTNELQRTGLNSSLTLGLTSGLISEQAFRHAARYYTVDISRRFPADDNIPKSITIKGKITSKVPLDLVCFTIYERTIDVDLETGVLTPPV